MTAEDLCTFAVQTIPSLLAHWDIHHYLPKI